MNYELINNFKAEKEKILKSKKKNLTRKDIGTLGMRPTEKRTITIQVKLPTWTRNDNDNITKKVQPTTSLRKINKKRLARLEFRLKSNNIFMTKKPC